MPESLTYFHLYGDNIHWTYTGVLYPNPIDVHLNNVYWTYNKALPSNLTHLHLEGNNIYFIYEGELPNNLVYLHLFGNNTGWIYEGAMPNGLTYLYLSGANINWTYAPWNFTNNFRYYTIYTIGVLHTRENVISVLNKGAQVTWTSDKLIYLFAHANMADTNQGGIWGDFSDIENFQPSQTALDLKTLVKVRNVTVILNEVSMPGATGDGTGFPQNFGTWWRS